MIKYGCSQQELKIPYLLTGNLSEMEYCTGQHFILLGYDAALMGNQS
jgi:hypothetical protein